MKRRASTIFYACAGIVLALVILVPFLFALSASVQTESDLIRRPPPMKRVPDASEFSVAATERDDSVFGTPVYEVRIIPGKNQAAIEKTLTIQAPIWTPEPYGEITKALLGIVPAPEKPVPTDDPLVLRTLLDLRPATLEQENQRVSTLLHTGFNDPTAHEEDTVRAVRSGLAARACFRAGR